MNVLHLVSIIQNRHKRPDDAYPFKGSCFKISFHPLLFFPLRLYMWRGALTLMKKVAVKCLGDKSGCCIWRGGWWGVRSLFTVGAVWKVVWVRKENEREFSCCKWSGGSVRLKRYLFGVIHACMLRDARWRAVASSIQLITGNRSGCAKEGLCALHILLFSLFVISVAQWFWELQDYKFDSQERHTDTISWMQICEYLNMLMHNIWDQNQ